jgi:hypothetical protein
MSFSSANIFIYSHIFLNSSSDFRVSNVLITPKITFLEKPRVDVLFCSETEWATDKTGWAKPTQAPPLVAPLATIVCVSHLFEI